MVIFMRKQLLALTLTLLSASLSSQAAVSNAQLSFSWVGTVPPATVAGSGWKFTDLLGNDFVPRAQTLQVITDADQKVNFITSQPVVFNLTSNNTNNLNRLDAYLAGQPNVTGLVGNKQLALTQTFTAPGDDEMLVSLNQQALKVGDTNKVQIASCASSTSCTVGLMLHAKVTQGNVAHGSTVNFTTPVVFAVDLASSSGQQP